MTNRTDHVALTATELSYLLTVESELTTVGRRAADVLGLTEPERDRPGLAAGLSSLLVRGLVVSDGQRVTLAPTVGAVTQALRGSTTNVQIGFVSKDKSDGALVFDAGSVRVLITPRLHRCFDAVGLDHRAGLAGQLVHMSREFLQRFRPGVVSAVMDTTGSGRAEDLKWATVSTDAEAWSVGFSRDPAQAETGLTETQAFERLLDHFVQLLGDLRPA